MLSLYLVTASVRSLWLEEQPKMFTVGIAYLAVTAAVMFTLTRLKRDVEERLGSQPFLAEASMASLDGYLIST